MPTIWRMPFANDFEPAAVQIEAVDLGILARGGMQMFAGCADLELEFFGGTES